jgi:hypothetical protein
VSALLKTVVMCNIFVLIFKIPWSEVVVAPDGGTGVHCCYEASSYKPFAEHRRLQSAIEHAQIAQVQCASNKYYFMLPLS